MNNMKMTIKKNMRKKLINKKKIQKKNVKKEDNRVEKRVVTTYKQQEKKIKSLRRRMG